MENQDFLQLSAVNSSLTNLGQPQSNFLPNDLMQPLDANLNRSGSFNGQIKAEIPDIRVEVIDYDQYVHKNVLRNSTAKSLAPTSTSKFPTTSNGSDFLIGDVTSVNAEAVLASGVTTAKQQLESFPNKKEFEGNMKLAWGNGLDLQEADALIQDIASGEAIPEIKILPAATINANGAFGEGAIYISDEFLTKNAANPKAVAGVLLEEIGHYVDLELNSIDSPGDEGNIFSKLVQGETIAEVELTALKVEDDSTTINLNGKEVAVELANLQYPGYLMKYKPGGTLTYDANVEQWQQRISDLGKDIDVDGLYGSQSAQIARQFQQEKGLEADGIVGPDTWAATFDTNNVTNSSSSGLSSVSGLSSIDHLLKYELGVPLRYDEDAKQWQQQMSDRGWNITVDGLYGSQSAQIARQFQQEKGLEADGIVGSDTWAATFDTNNVTGSSVLPLPNTSGVSGKSLTGSTQQMLDVARSFIGVQEQGGNNRGTQVEKFQKAVDGIAQGEPWCMSFAQSCIVAAESATQTNSRVAKSEHCLTVWNNSPSELRRSHPEPGSLVIWQYGTSTSGHVGIVEAVNSDGTFTTIEGNTSDSSGINREGDGVYRKQRDMDGAGDMRVVGFLKVFPDSTPVEPNQVMSADAAERWSQVKPTSTTTSYPGYNLKYDPSAPEYNEDPAVVRLWQQRMQNLGYSIEVDGYYGEQSVQVARQFQANNGLEVDGYVGTNTWAASFSLGTPTASSSETSPSPTPTTSADATERQAQAALAEEIEEYQSLYIRELYKESDLLETIPAYAETTWNITAKDMLAENKDFLIKAAERYGIDGRAIAGAIRWEYEKSYKGEGVAKVYSREFDEFAYNYVQETGSLDMDYSDALLAVYGASNPIEGIPWIGEKIQGNGWGKMHYETARKVLEASGEEVPDNRTLAKMLALPTSSIDLIARFMQQAAIAYSEQGFDIRYDPAVLATLYRLGEDKMTFAERAAESGTPRVEKEGMGEWVVDNLGSLEEYRTTPG